MYSSKKRRRVKVVLACIIRLNQMETSLNIQVVWKVLEMHCNATYFTCTVILLNTVILLTQIYVTKIITPYEGKVRL